ncbi:phosphomannomutase/phosphoglucomutase [Verrucomicrobiota bacterium]
MSGIFKAYDIRGIYGEVLNDAMAFQIGRAVATLLKPKRFAVGRDMRTHSGDLFEKFVFALQQHGVDVIDLGLVSSPMTYFANATLEVDGSAMITASHNGPDWNGFKICKKGAVPFNKFDIAELQRIVETNAYDKPPTVMGLLEPHDISDAYAAHIKQYSKIERPLKVVADYANAMGIKEGAVLNEFFEMVPLFGALDGTMPNHEANPLNTGTLAELQKKVVAEGADFGVAFDGDADRVGFVDEKGQIVSMDKIVALIAEEMLKEETEGTVLYDVRCSKAVKEVIQESGGVAKMCRVGHSFIKNQMKEDKAIFAGELSGHYYFRENFYTESAALAVVYVANLLSQTGKTLSELVAPVSRYFASGEINLKIDDAEVVFAKLREVYGCSKVIEFDGITFDFGDWRFNARVSSTEGLLRINLEADDAKLMDAKRDEVLALVQG